MNTIAVGLTITGVTMVGGAYHNGRYCRGWNVLHLSNGKQITVDGDGFDSILDMADKLGYDTSEYRAKLDNWVKTGKMA